MKGKGKEGKRETLEVLKNGGEAEVFVVRDGWVLVEICSSSHLFPPYPPTPWEQNGEGK